MADDGQSGEIRDGGVRMVLHMLMRATFVSFSVTSVLQRRNILFFWQAFSERAM
jgi:hypothetical protein